MGKITKLIIASHNKGKLKEIAALVKPFNIETISAADLDLPEPEETETTFVGNALLKARAAANESGMVALADDSGLEVFALGGNPGIYSARWAGEARDFYHAMARVETELANSKSTDKGAQFICVLALVWPRDETGFQKEMVFEGVIKGKLQFPPLGDKGFGYDPIFVAEGHDLTFAQLEPEFKHSISHRAMAFEKLVNAMKSDFE